MFQCHRTFLQRLVQNDLMTPCQAHGSRRLVTADAGVFMSTDVISVTAMPQEDFHTLDTGPCGHGAL